MTLAMPHRSGIAVALLILLTCTPARAVPDAASEPRPQEDVAAPAKDLESDPEVYLQLISRLQDKRLYFASLAHLDAFDRRWPSNRRSTLLRADALRETGYLDQAAALYEGLQQGPLAAQAHHGLGLIASKKGDLNAALIALSRANRLDPTNAAVLNDLGYTQIMLQQMAEAGFNLHKATELDPKNTRAGANLALFYLLDHKPAQAEGVMDWYQLPERQRKEINAKASELATRITH